MEATKSTAVERATASFEKSVRVKPLILETEDLPRGSLSIDTKMVKAGQSCQIWSNIQIWSKTGQKRRV